MKKFWKIFGITLGSILGVLLLVVGIAIYVVFTPKRLTPIVRDVVADYVTCEHTIGDVELTFFSTFPEFGVKINGLYLINPMEGAQSDTLLAAPTVVATVNVKAFLDEKNLDVHEVTLRDVKANLFINEAGESNLDVFALSNDTTEEDTTAFSLPFEGLKIDALEVEANTLSFISRKDSIDATLYNTSITASATSWDDINLALRAEHVNAALKGEQYLSDLTVKLNAPHTGLQLSPIAATLRGATVALDEFSLQVDGNAVLGDDIAVDAAVKAENWDVVAALQLLPPSISKLLDGIEITQATLSLDATAKGIYNDSTMPLIDAKLQLTDAAAAYMEVFPYRIKDIDIDATAHLDLNQTKQSTVKINSLHARTGETTVDATGTVSEPLDDLLADLNFKLNVNLPEFKQYLAQDGITTDLQGRAMGKAHANIRLSDLQKMNLKNGDISGDIALSNLALVYDSMQVESKQMSVNFQIPNKHATKKSVNWVEAKVGLSDLHFSMIGTADATLGKSSLRLEASDVLSNNPVLCANIGLTSDHIVASTDSIAANLLKPEITAYAAYNTKDTTVIPTVEAGIKFDDLKAEYADIKAHLQPTTLAANLSAFGSAKNIPRVKVLLNTQAIEAAQADDIKAKTKKLSLAMTAQRDASKENLLLQWNPQLSVDLVDGNAVLAQFPEAIDIPHIKFNYSNRNFTIKESRVILGNSDFNLAGTVKNIGKWLDKKGNLWGELEFTSEHTDVNELMALFSADSGSEETEDQAAEEKVQDGEANPFLVPKDVDLTLTTNIQEAVVFDQLARNLGGRLYVKDGILILEEMGFVCNAAKLQLTAMYKTPRRNHLYVGLDYHMIDINIQELVNMIPQVDSMLPMLRSFRGSGEFHIAAETYMNANYDLKMSTARGAMSITGKDLVLLDGETFSQIAKILLFKKKTENLVDSISVQATLFKKEIDIYPFCLTIDKYMAAVGGRHNTDMSFDYHIDLLKPLYIGVDVSGTFDDLKVKPAKCKYAQDFRPIIRKDVETQNASLKKMIDSALKQNVRIE